MPRGPLLVFPDIEQIAVVAQFGDDAAWREKVMKKKIRSQPKEWPDGKFIHPHDACFDKAGNIFVVEWVQTGRVTFLKKV